VDLMCFQTQAERTQSHRHQEAASDSEDFIVD
jgi:hypothetical protein